MIAAHPLATIAICRDCGCGAFRWPGRSEIACVHGHGIPDLPPLPVREDADEGPRSTLRSGLGAMISAAQPWASGGGL